MDTRKFEHLQVEYLALVRVRDSLNVKLLDLQTRMEEEEKKS